MRALRRGFWLAGGIGLFAVAAAPAFSALVQKQPPYFASISAKKARMRTGPGKTYPAIWEYRRADLPVKVIGVFERGAWLKIEDLAGTQGWMLGSLIAEVRTGVVTGPPASLLDEPREGARVRWRAAPGVVGRVSKCARNWCYFDVHGRGGYVETIRIWGVEPGEVLP